MEHPIEWHTAKPLWPKALNDAGPKRRFKQPALLRFDDDQFMERIQGRLATNPEQIADWAARRETWEEPEAGWQEPGQAKLLKLYQPVHQRFYLVAASLVCKIPGMPDRAPESGETVSFVVRRLQPTDSKKPIDPQLPSSYQEYGWVEGPQGKAWLAVGERPAAGEERLPLFPAFFPDGRQRRRLWLGLVPTSSGDTYKATGALNPLHFDPADGAGDPLARDPRVLEFHRLLDRGLSGLHFGIGGGGIGVAQAREVFLMNLAEMTVWISEHLPQVWSAVQAGAWTGPVNALKTVFDAFDEWFFNIGQVPAPNNIKWHAVLKAVFTQRLGIFDGSVTQLSFANPPINPSTIQLADAIQLLTDLWNNIAGRLTSRASFLDSLGQAVALSGSDSQTGDLRQISALKVPKHQDGALYHLRCVYERPQCQPDHRFEISRPSAPFELASFFDPEAPYRQLNIRFPVDTSLKGLRKFPKSVSFLLSNSLRKQMSQFENLKLEDLDKGKPGAGSGFNLGMICSFSIPIITICALILLMIFVFLLNIVFWWLPLFRICLPLNLKAK